MITLYNRKNTNESLGENEKHSTGKTHHRQICRATKNMTGCQWTSGICPLWRFLGEIVGDNLAAVPERWCKEEELSTRSIYEIVQGKVREALEWLVMLTQKPVPGLQSVSYSVQPVLLCEG